VKSYKFALGTICTMVLCLSLNAFAAKKESAKPVAFPEDIATKIVADYSKHVFNSYVELLKANKALSEALHSFTKSPSKETQEAAKTAWLAARKAYSPTEPFRFYGGPIDAAETGPEGLMNAWPLDEAYVDYVKDDPKAGIINNPKLYPTITKELLLSLNEKDGEKNISTGYHAIEFLLWGQDFDLKTNGQRSFNDYVVGKAENAERRATYLNLLGDLLVEHSQQLIDGWDPTIKGNYLEKFLKEPAKESIQKIFLGMGTLAMDEMSGERMTVPLEKHDQENEQDCFSDNTDYDLRANQEGIINTYEGNYQGFSGLGVKAFIKAIDPAGEKKVEAQLNKTLSLYKKLKHPFDNIIMEKKNGPGRKVANQIIDSLQAQSKLMAKSIALVGLDINIDHKESK
jgi:putative iron-regulated protein